MKLYSLMANLKNCTVLIVGGGNVATRMVKALLETGADILVVSPAFTAELQSLINKSKIKGNQREFSPNDLRDISLVFAATDDPHLNKTISQEARVRNIPVNDIAHPELCSFFVPSHIRRGDLLLAISTSGESPALAKWLRESLEKKIGPEYGTLVTWMGTLRKFMISHGFASHETKRISEYLLHHDILNLLKTGDRTATAKVLHEAFQSTLNKTAPEPLMATLGLN